MILLEYPISLNHPHYYEKNWGKKYTYILAFSYDSVDDITYSYTNEWKNVQERRGKDNQNKVSILMIIAVNLYLYQLS